MCPHCAQNLLNLKKNVTRLQLFPAKEPLKSVSIDILYSFISTSRKNENLLFIMGRFSKMTKTIPMKVISVVEVTKHFVSSWVFNYAPPEELSADNADRFTSKYFQNVCRKMTIKNKFITMYHIQPNGRSKDTIKLSWQHSERT